MLNNAQRLQSADTWPPYNIIRKGEDDYSIELAVAGFAMGDLDITQERNVLVVKGGATQKADGEYLHRGISAQSFERRFELADHVRVEGASLSNGLLIITLKREIPEQAKPRRIQIDNRLGEIAPLQIDADKRVPDRRRQLNAVSGGLPGTYRSIE